MCTMFHDNDDDGNDLSVERERDREVGKEEEERSERKEGREGGRKKEEKENKG